VRAVMGAEGGAVREVEFPRAVGEERKEGEGNPEGEGEVCAGALWVRICTRRRMHE